ncbi:hypothetical protein NLM27_41380 [Bradyrhizobium sp. CCGB12]|nr:hypothetical protein [Bradyrhizobium sp. CCGB12]MCP3395194.1 hypothetical protein [Bradyrhizobium sp. CCGB12]
MVPVGNSSPASFEQLGNARLERLDREIVADHIVAYLGRRHHRTAFAG